ncbi:EthD family reductase [uncultured Bradyrhizobium sp.]|uniref:EthD family reductase n=1 Tax=uncultured Bradyrhizobium sp. TaxID=199684 RepID=UPI0035C9730C
MAKLLVLYKKPKDINVFDAYYFATHVPLAKKLPGLKKYDVSTGGVVSPAGASGIHLVATLYFDSLDAIKAALGSAEGQATARDLGNFADGGVDLYFFDTKEV